MKIADIRANHRFEKLSTWALVGAVCGMLADVAFLPEAARAFLLLTFILLGPGSAVVDRVAGLPTVAVRALVPITGLAVVVLVVSVALLMGVWSSRMLLLAMAVLTAGVALIRLRQEHHTSAVTT